MSMEISLRISAVIVRPRKEFHLASKLTNETIGDWFNRLVELAKPCNYGYYLEAFLLDQFLAGLDDTFLEHLCAEQGDFSLTNIFDLYHIYESDESHPDKRELINIKQEEHVSDTEQYDDYYSNDNRNDTDDYHTNDFQPMIPLIIETSIEPQPVAKRPKLYECYLCHKTWKTIGHLTYHFLQHHTSCKTLKCHLCGKWKQDPSNLIRHLNMHLSEKPYKCELCGLYYARSTSFKNHMREHSESKNAQTFECLMCQKTLMSMRHLRLHNKTHDEPSLSQIMDELIEKRKLSKAESKTLGLEKQFECEICSIQIEDERAYDEHMINHCTTGWLCHLCGKKLVTKHNLINHYISHTKEKPFKCDKCDKKFSFKDKLKLHAKIHSNVRPHLCIICNKSFIQKCHLVKHIATHSVKEIEFKCDQCPKEFSSKIKFEIHLNMHDGFKLHDCNVCGKSFKSKWHRNDHERIHTGEKPFQCHICSKRFTQRAGLSVHLKWHSKPKPAKRIRKKNRK